MEQQKKKLEKMENFDQRKQELLKKKEELEKKLEQESRALSDERKRIASDLSAGIREGLKELNFLSVEFEIRFSRTATFSRKGYDAV